MPPASARNRAGSLQTLIKTRDAKGFATRIDFVEFVRGIDDIPTGEEICRRR